MFFWLIIIFLFLKGAIFLSTSLFDSFFPKESNSGDYNITINNYTTEQHLHITEGQAKRLSKK